VSVSDGRGGTATGSATATGINRSPTCVVNGGATLTVHHLTWTDPVNLAITDLDGDVVPGCTSIGSANSQTIGIGPSYSNCTSYAPQFAFRPSCVPGTPTGGTLVVRVNDGWSEGVCYTALECWQ
jgi:hypothetical protein